MNSSTFTHSVGTGYWHFYQVRFVVGSEGTSLFEPVPPLPAGRSIARYLIDLYVARWLGAEPVFPV